MPWFNYCYVMVFESCLSMWWPTKMGYVLYTFHVCTFTYCEIITPFGDRYHGRHRPHDIKPWPVNVELFPKVFCGIHVRAISQAIGFRSRFSQCVDHMRFNEKSFCFRWQETTKLMLFFNTKTSSLVVLCDLRYLTGNISSVMTKHMGVQRKLHRFSYLIVQIIYS